MSQPIVLLRRSEFARRLGVSKTTVRAWVLLGEEQPGAGVRSVRFPTGERRIPESEVERILGGHTLS